MRYLGQRLVQFVLVFVVVTFMVMAFTRIGLDDPARDLAGGAVSEEQIEQVKEDYPYLDKPLAVQYVLLAEGHRHRRLGLLVRRQPVDDRHVPAAHAEDGVHRLLGDRHRPADRRAARRLQRLQARRHVRPRRRASARSRVISTPPVVVAVLLLFLVVSRFELLPDRRSLEYVAPWDNPVEHFKNFFIPALMLGSASARCGAGCCGPT